jgi:DNA-binding NarL/FixJ family response regulator
VIADDSDAYRSGIVRAVRAHPDLELVAEAGDGVAALAGLAELRPDVALLDVRMPRLDGFDVIRRLRALRPPAPTRVLLLSAYMDDNIVAHAKEVGADAYLSKEVSRKEICETAVRIGRS